MVRIVRLRSLASLALQLGILVVLIAAFFVRTPQVSGLSMSPHISSGEYVLINTLAYKFSGPARGDIIAFRHDGDTPEVYIKRIVAVGGDRVRIDRGSVYVNGARVDESYVRYQDGRSFPETTVPQNTIFVLGDNRANSEDSRFFGPVEQDRVIGRAIYGVWPVAAIGAL